MPGGRRSEEEISRIHHRPVPVAGHFLYAVSGGQGRNFRNIMEARKMTPRLGEEYISEATNHVLISGLPQKMTEMEGTSQK